MPLSSRSRLSPLQREVLQLAAEDRLEWVRPVLSGGGYLSFPEFGNSPKRVVNRRTVTSLVERGLLAHPTTSRHLMVLTSAGREVLR